ncbi:hemicentin-2-like [Anguilla anguilla]|uniref:hemicentin-2-like n=1 Tax=Anguilla anguilla TaxID=7936 RepID=UPI0015AA97FE|nr:hemicentin-2-like [Anguilla anguilla]
MERTRSGQRLLVLLTLLQGPCGVACLEVRPSVNPARVGDNVTFDVSPSMPLTSGVWSVGSKVLVYWIKAQEESMDRRASVNTSTGTLSLTSVTVSDSGVYSLKVNNPQSQAKANLTVLEPVSNVAVSVSTSDPVEFNDTVVLTCSASGSALSFQWRNVSSDITDREHMKLTGDNRTLVISNVTRFDHGPFYCFVSNGIGNDTSAPQYLNISYGPGDMIFTIDGSQNRTFPAGSNLTLSCSAQSSPPALFEWAFNGKLLKKTPELELEDVQENQSGNYTCWAHNARTLRDSSLTEAITITRSRSESVQPTVRAVALLSFLLAVVLHFRLFLGLASRMEYTVGGVLVLLLLISSKGLSALEVRISKNPVSVGENVTLELIPQTAVQSGLWLHDSESIVLAIQGVVQVTERYRDRITFDAKTWALSLRNVTLADNGSYTMQGITPSFLVKTTLYVLEPVSNVKVRANATDLVELNDTVSLTCSASGSSLFYRWHNGSSDITASELVHLSDGNSTLTISRVLRSDSGPLYCSVSNSISNGTSQAVFLNISYGPDNVEISGNPHETVYRAGSDIILSCLAQSKPAADYYWAFEGTLLQNRGPELRLSNVHQDQSGNYSCWAHNSVTLRYSSRTTLITVVAPITSVLVNSNGGMPIDEKPFTLVCEVNEKADLIQWLRNGLRLLADNRTALTADNSSVTFTPVQRSDDGSYQCVAHNAVSNGTSPGFQLLVNYGPEQPVITGPDLAKTGSSVTFTCSALSQPISQYSWYFNGTRVANGSEYVTAPLTLANQGTYTCEAFNPVTGRNSTAVKELAVLAPITSVLVNSNGGLPIDEKPFTLVCKVNEKADLIQWLRNGLRLLADNRTALTADNSSVTFTPVQRSDDGSYQCVAHNAVSNGTSPGFQLLVNYGPEQPVITGPDLAKTGSNVTFTCSALSQPISHYSWYFNGTRVTNGSEYVTAPLTLANQGTYTCEAFNPVTGRNSTAVKELAVVAPITSVLVNSNGGLPIDEKPFTLVCKVSGKANFIQWLRNGLRLLADNRTALTADNSSVTFTPVQRSDDGSYQCVAHNAVSNGTSPGFQLLVNYGPEQPVITGPDVAKTGSSVTFNCSALSQPTSQYSWYFNGTRVTNSSEYVTAPLTLANQGTYTCEAFNPVTGRNSTAVKALAVIAPITNVLVNSNGGLPIDEKPFTLVCEVNGKADFIQWLRNGLRLLADNRTALTADNSSVTFTPVQRSDDGSYQCVAHNAVSNGTSPGFQLLVNYGPEQPVITGPDLAKTGSSVTFTCSALSLPTSQYSWYFNGTRVTNSSEYVTAPLTLANQGAYTCEAFNPVTGRNSTAVKALAVIAPITSVLVNSNGGLPIDEKPFTLVCNVNEKADLIQWLRNGLQLLADNRTALSADNSSVTFTPVQRSDDGSYQCVAHNAVSNGTSPGFQLLVNYGPEQPVITGPDLAKTGSSVTFTCSALSLPTSQYSWYFNGTRVTNGPEYVTAPLTLANQGTYTCEAFNPVTGRNSTAARELKVQRLSALEVRISKNPVSVGENVTLELIPQTAVQSGLWIHDSESIVLAIQGVVQVTERYRDRITFDAKTWALSLRNVTLADNGSYTMQGITPSFLVKTTLYVLEPVSNVIVRANATDLVELNDTVSLTCSASGSSLFYRWLNGSSDITASELVHLSDGNSTLTISRVLRSDSGPLYCNVSNSISNGTSQAVFLNISYGPDNVEISGNPHETVYRAGSDIILSCLAQSKPAADYHWAFEGTLLQNRGPELRLSNVHQDQSGTYSCWAHNSVTLRYSSRTTLITVVAPITSVLVNSNGGLPIDEKPFTLVCKVNGTADLIQWLRNGSRLLADNRTALTADNSSVTFTPVQRSDDGSYQCVAHNAVSNGTSPGFQLLVNYGPEQPVITGPDVAKTGSNVTFTCSALSQPISHYSWYFNGTRVTNGSEYVTAPLTLANQGTYTCEAFNPVTGRNSTAARELKVQPSSAVLSKGSLFLAALGVSLLQLTNWLSC